MKRALRPVLALTWAAVLAVTPVLAPATARAQVVVNPQQPAPTPLPGPGIIPAGPLITDGSVTSVTSPTPTPTGPVACNAIGCVPVQSPDIPTLPPSLLPGSGAYLGTPAQVASLGVLQQQAITATLKGHGLPASDTNAVLSWGRNDTLAELWSLTVQAIQTGAASRTRDQQNVVDWLSDGVRRENVLAARAAGLEYVKWSGRDINTYNSLVANNVTQSDLKAFFTGNPCASGYCSYKPPAPYDGEYNASKQQSCYTVVFNPLVSGLPTSLYPTKDDFVKWGAAALAQSRLSSSTNLLEVTQLARSIAIGTTFGAAMVAAGATYAAASTALSGVLASSSLVSFLFPFAARAGYQVAKVVAEAQTVPTASYAVSGAATGSSTSTGFSGAAGSGSAAAEAGGAVTASAVAFVGAVIIIAITIAVLQGISVFQAAELPDQMATVVTDAPNSAVDLPGMLNDSSKVQGLYMRFVQATLPSPSFETCPSVVKVSLDADGLPVVSRPCLNPTAIPDRKSSDPWFAVTANDATSPTYAQSISWKDSSAQTSFTTRLSGNWFISDVSIPGQATSTVQTLRVRYTDWNGNEQTAWLLGNPGDGYKFARMQDLSSTDTLDTSTCLANGQCDYTSSIKYVGTDGVMYSASVIATAPSTPTPVTVLVSGSYVNGMPRALFTYTTNPAGVALTGTLSCTRVGEASKYDLAINVYLNLPGGYTLSGTTCSGLSAPSGYSLSGYQGVLGGFMVSIPLPGQVEGARIRQSGTIQIYLIDDTGFRRHIPDPTTYNNLFRDWNGFQDVADVSGISSGPNLTSGAYLAIAQETMQTVYLVDNGQKRGVTSPAVMDKFYWNYGTVRQVPQSALDALPTGLPIS